MENTTKKTKTMLFEELREIVIDVVKDKVKELAQRKIETLEKLLN
jgi:hypothetical protein